MADKNVTISVEVVLGQAKSALSDMASATQKATDQIKNMGAGAGKAGADIGKGFDAAGKSTGKFFDTTTMGVLKGLASYDLLKKGAGMAFDFLKGSIEASMRASEQMAMVGNNIKNAGLSFDEISPKLKAYSEQMIQLGFDDEETALSVSKLAIVTGDYGQALKLNQLAMDLSRNKTISLESATKMVAMVTQGNTRALREYGIGMSDTATIADVLTEAQLAVGDSAKTAAETPAGRLRTLQVQWENMREEVGDALVPAMEELYDIIQDNLPAIQALAEGIATVVGVVGKSVGWVVGKFQDLGWAIGNVINAAEGLPIVERDVAKATNEVTTANKDAAKSYDGIGAKSKAATQAGKDYEQQMKDLKQAVIDVTQKQSEFSFKSVEDFGRFAKVLGDTKTAQDQWLSAAKQGFDALKSSINSVNSTITDLNGKITDARKSFDEFVTATTKDAGDNFAQIVFDAEKAVKELPGQIADARSSGGDTSELKKQLKDAQEVIRTSRSVEFQENKEFLDQLKFLREQDKKDTLEKAFAVMQRTIANKKKETEETVAQIQKQIDAATAERDAFTAAQTIMTQAFEENVKLRLKSSQTEIGILGALQAAANNAAAAYRSLTAAASSAPKASTSTGSSTSSKRAVGGPVGTGMPYLVGENGPEIFTPNMSGNITPNQKVSAQGGLTIQINYPTVRNDQDLDAIIGAVEDAFSRRDELARMGAYK